MRRRLLDLLLGRYETDGFQVGDVPAWDGSDFAPTSTSGGNPSAGEVFRLNRHATDTQSIPHATWTQLTLDKWGVANPQSWASVAGDEVVIDPTGGMILVVTQVWVAWQASAVGNVRGLLLAHLGGGTPQFLDDNATLLTPAQYAALSDFEGSMGVEGINRVDPVDALSLEFWAYQDSGGPLDLTPLFVFVTPIA